GFVAGGSGNRQAELATRPRFRLRFDPNSTKRCRRARVFARRDYRQRRQEKGTKSKSQAQQILLLLLLLFMITIGSPNTLVRVFCVGGHVEIAHGPQILHQVACDHVISRWEGS
ncbi:hypothetical protein CFP56_019720, partial [Quercus suber]